MLGVCWTFKQRRERRWCQRRIGHVLSQCFQPSSLRKPLPPGPRRRAILRPHPRRMSRHSERWEEFSSRFSLVRLSKHGCMALVFEQEARKPSRSNCPQPAETKSHNDDFTTAASKMQSSMLPQSTLESPRLAAGMMPCSQEARSTCATTAKSLPSHRNTLQKCSTARSRAAKSRSKSKLVEHLWSWSSNAIPHASLASAIAKARRRGPW